MSHNAILSQTRTDQSVFAAFSRQSCTEQSTAVFRKGLARRLKSCATRNVTLVILLRDKVGRQSCTKNCRCDVGLRLEPLAQPRTVTVLFGLLALQWVEPNRQLNIKIWLHCYQSSSVSGSFILRPSTGT